MSYDVFTAQNISIVKFFLLLFDRVNGKRYFECPPKYGSMIPVMSIDVGDYPPEDYDLDEEI